MKDEVLSRGFFNVVTRDADHPKSAPWWMSREYLRQCAPDPQREPERQAEESDEDLWSSAKKEYDRRTKFAEGDE